MDNSSQDRDQPLVSILMLTYNRARYLSTAIESVLGQTYTSWELFVIDDGSTDDTKALMSRYPDDRIRYIRHEERCGLFVRRSESLTYPRGTYTAVLDSDDLWHDPEKLKRQVAFLERCRDHVLVGTFARIINDAGAITCSTSFATIDAAIRRRLLFRNQFVHSSVLMRSSAVHSCSGYQSRLGEDLDLFLQLGTKGRMANIPEYMTSYRVHNGNTNDSGFQMLTAVYTSIKEHGRAYPYFQIARLLMQARILFSRLTSRPDSSYRPEQ